MTGTLALSDVTVIYVPNAECKNLLKLYPIFLTHLAGRMRTSLRKSPYGSFLKSQSLLEAGIGVLDVTLCSKNH